MSEWSKLALFRAGVRLGVDIRFLGYIHPVVGYWVDTPTDLDRINRVIARSRVLYLLRETVRPITDQLGGKVVLAQYLVRC